MSQTLSIGVVDVSDWTYMATVMYESLEEIIKTKKCKGYEPPKGVYKSAIRFFDLVLEATNGDTPKNPLASINAFMIASDVVSDSTKHQITKRDDVRKYLKEFRGFLISLPEKNTLNSTDKKTAENLKLFYQNLASEGEMEDYENAVQSDQEENEQEGRTYDAIVV